MRRFFNWLRGRPSPIEREILRRLIDVQRAVFVLNLSQIKQDLATLKELQMTTQEKIDAVTAAIDTATTGIRADIQTLKDAIANGQTADFTALDAKVAALAALDAENPAPAPLTAKKK